jgi:outer membrane protein assembly factor BamB
MEGKKDGVATIQLVGDLLVVQLRSGTMVAYDAERGTVRWHVHPGQPYPPVVQNATVDDRYVITVRDVRMFAYDRRDGHLEWMYELTTIPSSPPVSDGERVFITIGGNQVTAFELPARANTGPKQEGMITDARTKPPAASSEPAKTGPGNVRKEAVAIQASNTTGKPIPPSLSGSQATPSITVLESVAPPYRLNSNMRQNSASISVLPSVVPPYRINSEVQSTPAFTVLKSVTRLDELSQKHLPPLPLKKSWVLTMGVRVTQVPLVTSTGVVFASTTRDVLASLRGVAQETFHLEASSTISADLAQYGDTVFVPTIDASLVAVDGARGRVLWRFTPDSGVTQKPAVIGNDVFAVTLEGQLYRVDRETGESDWRDVRGGDRFVPEIRSFAAANDRYVYTVDATGLLTVIDRSRGIPLQKLNTRDYTYVMANDQTDRVYMASNNGALVCLFDRANAAPKRHPKGTVTAAPGGGDSATDLFKPSGAIKPKKVVEPPKSKEDKPKDDMPKEDKPKDTKPKDAKPPKGGKKPKDDAPKDDNKGDKK